MEYVWSAFIMETRYNWNINKMKHNFYLMVILQKFITFHISVTKPSTVWSTENVAIKEETIKMLY